MTKTHWIGLAVAVALALAIGFKIGRLYQEVQDTVELAALRVRAGECEKTVSQVKSAEQASTATARVLDQQLDKLQYEKGQQKQAYEDTIRVIRRMLPDRAEREIARYYERQQRPD